MRSVNNRILFGGLAALLACSGQISQAKDNASAGAPKDKTVMKTDVPAVPDETKPLPPRGVTIKPYTLHQATPPVRVNPDSVQRVTPITKVTPVVKVTKVTQPKTPKTVVVIKQPTKIVNTTATVPPPKNPKNPNGSGVINVSSKVSATAPFITAWLDRPGNNPRYKIGDKMVVNVSSTADCNVVVFNYDAQNTLTQIFPNDHQKDGRLKAGQHVQIGGDDSPFDYSVSGNGGVERIFVYAYPTGQQAPLTVAMAPAKQSPFRQSNKVSMNEYVAMVRDSAVFTTRGIEVVPKRKAASGRMLASASTEQTDPNKLELTFQVDAK